ncbi:M48 family metalloprotease [Actinokineospora globicatena]|uniref:M48 family metalloprotease n=1 Tax=Actinokineospora globicatena TaxID=103729 RepID=UPI0020A2CF04|nr:M48 family metallopeptidase [Actinokineospora globicatena]
MDARSSEEDLTSPPGADRATRSAAVLAVVSYLVTAAMLVFCWWLFVWASREDGISGYFLYGFAALMVLLTLTTGPRFGLLDFGHNVVERESAPDLYALVDRIADELGARRVWRIEVSEDFNAGYRMVWYRRRPVITLGYPLWNLLAPQERVALLAHELAHGVNGDSARSALIGPSLDGLTNGFEALEVPVTVDSSEFVELLAVICAPVGYLLTFPLRWLAAGQERLLRESSRRAEFYADHLATGVAGRPATVSMLAKLTLETEATRELVAAMRRGDADVWAAQRTCLAGIEDLSDIDIQDEHAVDSTHPSTERRIDVLYDREYGEPRLESSAREALAVDAELAAKLPEVIEALRKLDKEHHHNDEPGSGDPA